MTVTETTPSDVDFSEGEHDRFKHIVKGKDKLTEALINGTPVRALCGKLWVPGRDPDRYPLCGTCKEEYERITGRSA